MQASTRPIPPEERVLHRRPGGALAPHRFVHTPWEVELAAAARSARLMPPTLRSSRGESPKQVLERRYAKGDVDHDTYRRMLTELEN